MFRVSALLRSLFKARAPSVAISAQANECKRWSRPLPSERAMKAQIASELQQTVTEQEAKSSNEQLTKEQIAAEQEKTFTEQAAKLSVELLTKGQIAGEPEQTLKEQAAKSSNDKLTKEQLGGEPQQTFTEHAAKSNDKLTKEETVSSNPPSGEKGLFERPSDDHCEVCGYPFDLKSRPRSICRPAECLRCLGDWVAGCSSGDTHDDRKRRKLR